MAAILIIDDDTVSRMILGAIVRPLSTDARPVKVFSSAGEALKWTTHNAVSLVLTDYKMPRMNGVEFVRALRNNPSCTDVPVILVSAENDSALRHAARHAGVTDFIAKPVDHALCLERCRALLGT